MADVGLSLDREGGWRGEGNRHICHRLGGLSRVRLLGEFLASLASNAGSVCRREGGKALTTLTALRGSNPSQPNLQARKDRSEAHWARKGQIVQPLLGVGGLCRPSPCCFQGSRHLEASRDRSHRACGSEGSAGAKLRWETAQGCLVLGAAGQACRVLSGASGQ